MPCEVTIRFERMDGAARMAPSVEGEQTRFFKMAEGMVRANDRRRYAAPEADHGRGAAGLAK
jgi:hypothetical protein